jgi:hypothetical protein
MHMSEAVESKRSEIPSALARISGGRQCGEKNGEQWGQSDLMDVAEEAMGSE